MNHPAPHPAHSGSSMDTIVPRRRGQRIAWAALAALLAIAAAIGLWRMVPRGLLVNAADLRIATVERGVFLDDIVVRATAEPLRSVILDSVESGRVEEVLVADGALVERGQLLFRLSNPQRNLDLLARQAEHAQQISNLSNLRVAQEATRTEHQRRLAELQFALAQARKKYARNERLAAQGFISAAALEESNDLVADQQRAVDDERAAGQTDARVRGAALEQMEGAINGLQAGLRLVAATVDALAVRAPASGRLTGFRLQVGETVSNGQHIGRIDDPSRFKLTAQVDEYYLNRVAIGRHGSVVRGEQSHAVDVSAITPQIKDGRFTVELVFSGAQPAQLSPGQGLDARITLGEPAKALLLANGPFVNDGGAASVFVVDAGGRHAERRSVKVGRRTSGQIEILDGLAAGEKVIISSYAAYANATRLQLTK